MLSLARGPIQRYEFKYLITKFKSIIDNQNEGFAFEVMQHNAAFFCCQVNILKDYVPKKHGDAQYIWHFVLSTAFLNPFYLNGVLA